MYALKSALNLYPKTPFGLGGPACSHFALPLDAHRLRCELNSPFPSLRPQILTDLGVFLCRLHFARLRPRAGDPPLAPIHPATTGSPRRSPRLRYPPPFPSTI